MTTQLSSAADRAGKRRASYSAGRIKRARSTKTEVAERRERLFEIVAAMKPMTVRQCFYQATVADIVEKTEGGYDKVQSDLTLLRRAGILPYAWLTDHTRYERKPTTFNGVQEALEDTARLYRKALWADADCYVEVWIEKDALSGVVYPITSLFDVSLMSARGYASLSFLHGLRRLHRRPQRAGLHLSLRRLRSFGRQCRREDRGDVAPDGVRRRDLFRARRRHPRADPRLGPADAADEAVGQPLEGLRRDLGRTRRHPSGRSSQPRRGSDPAASAGGPIRGAQGRRGERTQAHRRPVAC